MTEPEDPSRDRLKHHFAQRVIHQARQILETWQRLQKAEWSAGDMAELKESTLRLLRFAERFEQVEHISLAHDINQALEAVEANRGRLNSSVITDLNRLMQRLSRTGLRHGDQLEQTSLPPLRKPVYVVLQDHERAERLAKQLEFSVWQPCRCTVLPSFSAQWRNGIRLRLSWMSISAGQDKV